MTALYRYYCAGNVLLYIGISKHPILRMRQHLEKNWAHGIATIKIEWHTSRAQAEAAEIAAIRSERPLYNKVGCEAERVKTKRPPRQKNPAPPWQFAFDGVGKDMATPAFQAALLRLTTPQMRMLAKDADVSERGLWKIRAGKTTTASEQTRAAVRKHLPRKRRPKADPDHSPAA